MFCPNCAAPNEADQHYCRACGLKLDAIAAELVEQRPSAEYAELLKKKNRFERLGVFSLSIAGIIGAMLLLSKVFYYKLILLGPELLFWSAFGALMLFGILSVFFFNYPKVFMNFDKLNPRLPPSRQKDVISAPTNKLLNESRMEPASVTEHSTELLPVERRK